RALAIDPLDPQVIYLGTDIAIVGSYDGGETWAAGQSFRNNSVSISATSPEAREILGLIEETGDGPAPQSQETGRETFQESVEEEGVASAQTVVTEKEIGAESAVQNLKNLERQLKEAQDAIVPAEKKVQQAELKFSQWTPDTLTIADVDSLTWIGSDYMDENDYAKLEAWLSERGLSAGSDGHEMQDTLKTYLEAQAAEGVELKNAVSAAQDELEPAKLSIKNLEEKVREAKTVVSDTDTARTSAEKALDDMKDKAAASEAVPPWGAPAAEDAGAAEAEAASIERTVKGVTYIEVDPSSSETIFLATFDGVYKSGDKGVTWSKVYAGANPSQSAGLCLAIDPSNPDAVFVGTLSGIARTTDGGQTWARPAGRVSDKVITRLAIHPFDSQVVLAGVAGKGIFKSSDGGATWTQCFSKASQKANMVLSIKFAPSQPQMIYAGTRSGAYKSVDGGESWESAMGLGLGSTVEIRDLLVSPTNPEVVYLATDRGVFGTTDGGNQWRRLTFGLTFKGSNFLAFDPLNAAVVWMITDNRAFQSEAPPYLDLSSGEAVTLLGSGEITVDGKERHRITIENIDEENGVATIVIQSEPQTIKLKIGESAEIDLTGNGKNDLTVTLEEIADGVPRFGLSRIAPVITPEEEAAAELVSPEEISGLEDLDVYFRAEPTWVEVQQAAARWAEVHPDKIAAWRRGASLRAFLPEVDFDFGRRFRSREDSDWSEKYSYSTSYDEESGRYREDSLDTGDEFKTIYTGGVYEFERKDYEKNRDETGHDSGEGYGEDYGEERGDSTGYRNTSEKGWGIGLEWDLAEFLYNKEQIRISKEARDLVELRQDVLEQVTLYFFDRRTSRIDMILNPPADAYSRVEMLLQIQQLDASLDAMTGGYFTRTIKEREK
ncbi:MAG: hypothetical protein P9M10_09165, partial [Candidatus Euphemobacter frigidus]|nr:hypothetical protein [Candidatus Euphemobacter frigidus]